MKPEEVGMLLGHISLADGRKPPEDEQTRQAQVAWWYKQIGDLEYADAIQAVDDHYLESTDWLKVAHIRARVKDMRFERLKKTPLPEPPPSLGPEEYLKWYRAERQKIMAPSEQHQALEGGR